MTEYEYQQLRAREALGLPLEEPDGPGHQALREYARKYAAEHPDYVDPEPPVSAEAIAEYKRLSQPPQGAKVFGHVWAAGLWFIALLVLLLFAKFFFHHPYVVVSIIIVLFLGKWILSKPVPQWLKKYDKHP